jgi:hypothetical protein
MMVRTAHAIGWVLAGALATSGCFGAQAKTIPEIPPLDMPAPPPRHVEATQPVMLPPFVMPGEPIPAPPPRQAAPPTQRADAPRPSEPPKPGVPPAEPPKVNEEGARPPAPPTTLQTAPAQREVEVERHIRTQLAQATANLNRIDYQALNADARTQYDIAKRFVAQADDALRVKNLVFANNLADKAAALAVQLVSRR